MTDSPHPWLQAVGHWLISGPMGHFVAFFFVAGALAAAVRAPLRTRKIQPEGFKWRVLRNEFLFGLLNVTTAALVLGSLSAYLTRVGLISFKARLKPRERNDMALSQDRGGDETCSQSNITLLWRRG
jgi:hypothetical protein